MYKLLSSTALALAIGLPSLTLAQTTPPAASPPAQTMAADMPGFLAMRGQSDLFASDLIGHDVHARRVASDPAPTGAQPGVATDGAMPMATMHRTDLDDLDNIGQIRDIVMSNDGQVRAIVIGVGGFLGMGEHDAAVTMDQVTFASNPDDPSETFIVVNTTAEVLKGSPRYERAAMNAQTAPVVDGVPATDRTAFTAPDMTREGYNRVAVTEVSTELLTGKSVYGVNDDSVGTVKDFILDDAGVISNVIIDFGGFLGLGSTQVALDFDELTILSNDGNADVRIYVDATKEQIQALPAYVATN